jgi:hypothetical protein
MYLLKLEAFLKFYFLCLSLWSIGVSNFIFKTLFYQSSTILEEKTARGSRKILTIKQGFLMKASQISLEKRDRTFLCIKGWPSALTTLPTASNSSWGWGKTSWVEDPLKFHTKHISNRVSKGGLLNFANEIKKKRLNLQNSRKG